MNKLSSSRTTPSPPIITSITISTIRTVTMTFLFISTTIITINITMIIQLRHGVGFSFRP